MNQMRPRLAIIVLLTVLLGSQMPVQEAVAQHTLWSFLGIPQAGRKIHGHLFNRRGNHPRLEKKTPLKALGDAANLESEVPAIKKAAEIKQAEDLKPQKIKAVKYLTQIGCGCYDTDGSITEALVAATDDCTEDVRLATVRAIANAASGACCANCGETCCCGEDIVKRLAVMAYEKDDTGCYIEPSERVRQAAAQALQICCPDTSPVIIESDERPIPPPDREGPEREGPATTDEFPNEPPLPPVSYRSAKRSTAQHTTTGTALTAQEFYRKYSDDRPTTVSASLITSRKGPRGVVVKSDPQRGTAHVHFAQREKPVPVGTQVTVYRGVKGGYQLVGHLEVTQSFPGSAHVRPSGQTTLAQLKPGDIVSAAVTRLASATR